MILLKYSFNKLISILAIGFLALNNDSLRAHEMWIEPIDFTVKSKGKIYAHHKVGQNFKGNTYAYLDKNFKHLKISQGKYDKDVKSRLGDMPFIQETVSNDGLVTLTAISIGNKLIYKTEDQFRKFIQSEKLNWVLAEHKKRGLPSQGFTELFIRSAKSLVKVGHGNGEDRKIGLPLEWVLKDNPYTTNNKNITACLYWQGSKVINKPIHIFTKVPVKSVDKDQTLEKKVTNLFKRKKYKLSDAFMTTDETGCVLIVRNKGFYLLNAVKMMEPDDVTKNKTNAVWESNWGSLTFSTLD